MLEIMLYLASRSILIFRNNVGTSQTGRGEFIRFGLCVGSSDLIGILQDGRFLAIECKSATGKATPEQIGFIHAINKSGGVAGICRSVDDVKALVQGVSSL